jgi:hypothetical protein
MVDYRDSDQLQRHIPDPITPTGRVYVHTRCGGATRVSGRDYRHICDPFWPCSSTYCCTCAGFAPLAEVQWADTGETVADYRRHMARQTPLLPKAWRCGVGFLVGAALGATAGLAVVLIVQAIQRGANAPALSTGALIGGAIGALLCYFIGTLVLNWVFDIDYRRMR